MPFPAKMDVLNTQICGNQQMGTSRGLQHSAVIADTAHHGPIPGLADGPPKALDQLPLWYNQAGLTISKKAI
jgi:hypothetical protein